jgi:anti-sigma factor RsiW
VARIIRMTHCQDIEPLVMAYVDGESSPGDREAVDRHRRRCPFCQRRLGAERAAREVLRRHAPALRAEVAAPAFKDRVASVARYTPRRRAFPSTLVRIAAAALVLVGLGASWMVLATRGSTVVLAAQLTADHSKCFLTARDAGTLESRQVADYLSSRYGFQVRVPGSNTGLGLRLVGARRCLSGEGTNAHLLYTWQGDPVSLYMLPADHRPAAAVAVLGHDTHVWSGHNGSYVLVTRATPRDLTGLISYMQHATE